MDILGEGRGEREREAVTNGGRSKEDGRLTIFFGSEKNSVRKSLIIIGLSSVEHRMTCLRLSV